MKRIVFIFLLLLSCPHHKSYAREPSLREVQEEATRFVGFDSVEIESWKKRARWSALLPRLQAGVSTDLKETVNLTTKDSVSVSGGSVFVGPSESNFDQNFNQGTSVDIRAVWYLNELVFNRDVLAASSEKRDWIRERNRTLQEITQAYIARKRLIKEVKSKSESELILEKKKMILDEAQATLDALTGGWYSEEIKR